jgi:hypothetical protein
MTHPYPGSSPGHDRPGHCDRCAEIGHVRAHPSLGCGDVGCEEHHPVGLACDSVGPARRQERSIMHCQRITGQAPETPHRRIILGERAGQTTTPGFMHVLCGNTPTHRVGETPSCPTCIAALVDLQGGTAVVTSLTPAERGSPCT